jgi:hypothetical protein
MSILLDVVPVDAEGARRIYEAKTIYGDGGHVVSVARLLCSEVWILHLLAVVANTHVGSPDVRYIGHSISSSNRNKTIK